MATLRKRRILEQAVALMGPKELAAAFRVSEQVLSDWMDDPKGMPDGRLIELAGILVAYAGATKQPSEGLRGQR